MSAVQDAAGAMDLTLDTATVTFEAVGFEYSAGTPVLHDVNFTAEGGQTIGLVGATGSGRLPPLRLFPGACMHRQRHLDVYTAATGW